MDRGHRHRAVLNATVVAGGFSLFVCVGGLSGQTPSPTAAAAKTTTPAPSTSATATPWVQAAPPPTAPPAKPSPRPEKVPSPAVTPAVSPSKDEVARVMARKREEELAKQTAAASPTVAEKPLPPRLMLPRLSPEENEAYEHNLALWLALPSDQRQEIRGLAAAHVQEETEKAYQASGLTLNEDQREVFALRYRQERRRLERDLQDKARAERERRLPEIMDRLKHEFAGRDVSKPKPLPTPTPSTSPTPTATPTQTVKS